MRILTPINEEATGLQFPSQPPKFGTILFSQYHATHARGAFQFTVFSLLPHA